MPGPRPGYGSGPRPGTPTGPRPVGPRPAGARPVFGEAPKPVYGGPRPMAPPPRPMTPPPRYVAPPPPRHVAPPPRPIAPPPPRPHHMPPPPRRRYVPTGGDLIAGALAYTAAAVIDSAVHSSVNTTVTQTVRTGTTYQTGNAGNPYTSYNRRPADYPANCPHCGANTSGAQTCDYCGAFLY